MISWHIAIFKFVEKFFEKFENSYVLSCLRMP